MSRSKKLLSVLVLLALSACSSTTTTTESSTATESAQIVNGLTIEPNANLFGASLYGAYLSDANLYGANLSRANLSDANLTNANLDQANLLGANLSGANLTNANLFGASLYDANLTNANLYGAYLYGADLYAANLTNANLSGADLTDANLTRANLSGANLTGANLSGADLTGANLSGADLTGANLVGTILEGSNEITTTTAIATIPEATATGNSDYGMICIPGSSCSQPFGGDRKYLDLVKTNLPLKYYDELSDSQLFKMAYYWCGFLYKNEWSKIEELFDGAYERGERNTQQLYIYTLLGAVTNYCLFVHDKKVGEYLDSLTQL